ncbi:37741_t:CDS:2, partial [Gigaspora margarita]
LSQSKVSISDECNNIVDDISVECDNSVNNNNILDERNNQYKNSLVNEYEYNLQPLRSTSKLLATMFRSNNTHMDEISDYIGMPEIFYDQCPFEW